MKHNETEVDLTLMQPLDYYLTYLLKNHCMTAVNPGASILVIPDVDKNGTLKRLRQVSRYWGPPDVIQLLSHKTKKLANLDILNRSF